MIGQLREVADKYGDQFRIVPVKRIRELQVDLKKFQEEENLSEYQNYVFDKLYSFEIPQEMCSVIIVASPHPSHGNAVFHCRGREYAVYGVVASPLDRAEAYMAQILKEGGYTLRVEANLPLKRLAVQAGLAEYGRNNVTYVKGMGSHFCYTAFSTDLPAEDSGWRDVCVSPSCINCNRCVGNCPTGALQEETFLIEAHKCLTAMNESSEDFPEWLPRSAHHAIFDCFRCQSVCPMNAHRTDSIDIIFDEEETEQILSGIAYDEAPEELGKKMKLLEMDLWMNAIPRNLNLLFDLMDGGLVPTM